MKLRTYCLACRKHVNNRAPWKVKMANKVVRDKSRGGQCSSDKLIFFKQKPKKKVVNNIIKQTC